METINPKLPIHSSSFFRNINCVPSLGKTAKSLAIHFITTLVITVVFFILYKDLSLCLASISFGLLLDSDHLVDYVLYLYKFGKKFNFNEFLSGSYFSDWKKFITPLHSYELAILLLVAHIVTDSGNYFSKLSLVISVSLFQHYMIDYLVNYVRPAAYSFIFRAKNSFIKSKIRA